MLPHCVLQLQQPLHPGWALAFVPPLGQVPGIGCRSRDVARVCGGCRIRGSTQDALAFAQTPYN